MPESAFRYDPIARVITGPGLPDGGLPAGPFESISIIAALDGTRAALVGRSRAKRPQGPDQEAQELQVLRHLDVAGNVPISVMALRERLSCATSHVVKVLRALVNSGAAERVTLGARPVGYRITERGVGRMRSAGIGARSDPSQFSGTRLRPRRKPPTEAMRRERARVVQERIALDAARLLATAPGGALTVARVRARVRGGSDAIGEALIALEEVGAIETMFVGARPAGIQITEKGRAALAAWEAELAAASGNKASP
jgi:hypothetical protein